jgi:hypothetical protein
VVRNLFCDGIVGTDFLSEVRARLDFGDHMLSFGRVAAVLEKPEHSFVIRMGDLADAEKVNKLNLNFSDIFSKDAEDYGNAR